jgi:nucleotide-binding universal stress UspA family protein
MARELALANGARVCLLAVVPTAKGEEKAQLHKLAHDSLRAVARKWLERKVPYEIVVRAGKPAATVVRVETELAVDLVVMATHGRTGKALARLGSVSEEVVRRSTRPVLTIRPA